MRNQSELFYARAANLERNVATAVGERDGLVADVAALKAALSTLSNHCVDLESSLALKTSEVSQARDELKVVMTAAADDRDAVTVEHAAIVADLESRIEATEGREQLKAVKIREVEEELRSIHVSLSIVTKNYDVSVFELRVVREELSSLETDCASLRSALSTMAAARVSLEESLETTEDELHAAQRDLDAALQKLAVIVDDEALRRRVAELEKLLNVNARELDSTQKVIDDLSARNRSLEKLVASELERKSVESERLTKILQQKDHTIVELEQQLSSSQQTTLSQSQTLTTTHANQIAELEQEVRVLKRAAHAAATSSGAASRRGSTVLHASSEASEEFVEMRSVVAENQRLATKLNDASSMQLQLEQLIETLQDRHASELHRLHKKLEDRDTELFEASIQASRDASPDHGNLSDEDEPPRHSHTTASKRLQAQLAKKQQQVVELRDQLDRVMKRVVTMEGTHAHQLAALFRTSTERQAALLRQLQAAQHNAAHSSSVTEADVRQQREVSRLIAHGTTAVAVDIATRTTVRQQVIEMQATYSGVSPKGDSPDTPPAAASEKQKQQRKKRGRSSS
ncbi:Hypothetical protein, putative [Bodo saltans]|uniref:Uncharacterized protein n=1 Tax=Bodo saltans TaxID=75058 RepID=A0A0S4JQ47_BODSA|nr:Hypothetical protein, putative [Bodo saltans]|eukprot:CUG92375.1 Hypothetical protein, putative [Bodo saltans]